jgi:hypothetical protein
LALRRAAAFYESLGTAMGHGPVARAAHSCPAG